MTRSLEDADGKLAGWLYLEDHGSHLRSTNGRFQ